MGWLAFDIGHGDDNNYAKQAAKQEKERQDRIKTGLGSIDTTFAPYNEDFYNTRAKAYEKFALPELSQQYQQTRNQLVFNLANRGLLKSGAATGQWNDLARTMAQGQQQIVDTGIKSAQDLRRTVEGQKDTLRSQLYASADPAQAAAGATSAAASFAVPSTFAPLGNMFGNIAQQYYLSQLINRNQPTSFVQPPSQGGGGPSSPVTSSY